MAKHKVHRVAFIDNSEAERCDLESCSIHAKHFFGVYEVRPFAFTQKLSASVYGTREELVGDYETREVAELDASYRSRGLK